MWLIFKWVFFLSFMTYFYHVGGGGISTLIYSLILYAMVVGGVKWLLCGDSPQGTVSPATAPPERRVEKEQGELVNARRGNPDPTRPKPDWMDNRPDWMKGN